jgi:hypothetical protein
VYDERVEDGALALGAEREGPDRADDPPPDD